MQAEGGKRDQSIDTGGNEDILCFLFEGRVHSGIQMDKVEVHAHAVAPGSASTRKLVFARGTGI